MIGFKCKSDFTKIETFLKNAKDSSKIMSILDRYGKMGVVELSHNTPIKSGLTASSWGYEIINNGGQYTIQFTNSNINRNVNIAIILQYGHGTRTGGYVQGRDYINPAMKRVFDQMTSELIKEVGR